MRPDSDLQHFCSPFYRSAAWPIEHSNGRWQAIPVLHWLLPAKVGPAPPDSRNRARSSSLRPTAARGASGGPSLRSPGEASAERMSRPARKVLLALLGGSVASLALLAVRMLVRGDATYGFLAWNLFLAWIPLLLAGAVLAAWRSGGRLLVAPLLVLWLLFFPNAPYVVTDFVHLRDIGGMPRWFDVLLLGGFALTSLALGFVSLSLIQNLVRATYGAVLSWAGALTAIALAGFGIYLGRIYQLNSWDVLDPQRLRAAISAASAHERGAWLTLLLTCLLAAAYVVGQRVAGRRVHAAR